MVHLFYFGVPAQRVLKKKKQISPRRRSTSAIPLR